MGETLKVKFLSSLKNHAKLLLNLFDAILKDSGNEFSSFSGYTFCQVIEPVLFSSVLRRESIFFESNAASSSFAFLFFQFGRNTIRYPGTWCYIDLHSGVTADVVFSFLYTIVELLLITFTVACNVAVICVLLRMRRRAMMLGKVSSLERRRQKMARETQMIISLVGITIVFVICYSPLTVGG